MEQNDLEKLEQGNPVIQVAIELGIKIQGSMGLCFRKDRHSSDDGAMTLFFNTARNTFFCKTCPDVGGSVIDLVSQKLELPREEATAWLAHRIEFDQLTKARYGGKGKRKM